MNEECLSQGSMKIGIQIGNLQCFLQLNYTKIHAFACLVARSSNNKVFMLSIFTGKDRSLPKCVLLCSLIQILTSNSKINTAVQTPVKPVHRGSTQLHGYRCWPSSFDCFSFFLSPLFAC